MHDLRTRIAQTIDQTIEHIFFTKMKNARPPECRHNRRKGGAGPGASRLSASRTLCSCANLAAAAAFCCSMAERTCTKARHARRHVMLTAPLAAHCMFSRQSQPRGKPSGQESGPAPSSPLAVPPPLPPPAPLLPLPGSGGWRPPQQRCGPEPAVQAPGTPQKSDYESDVNTSGGHHGVNLRVQQQVHMPSSASPSMPPQRPPEPLAAAGPSPGPPPPAAAPWLPASPARCAARRRQPARRRGWRPAAPPADGGAKAAAHGLFDDPMLTLLEAAWHEHVTWGRAQSHHRNMEQSQGTSATPDRKSVV